MTASVKKYERLIMLNGTSKRLVFYGLDIIVAETSCVFKFTINTLTSRVLRK